MGWISKRCKETGRSIGTGPKGAQKWPLRKIVAVLRTGITMFESDWVRLECGHEGRAYGDLKARCRKCFDEQPAAGKAET